MRCPLRWTFNMNVNHAWIGAFVDNYPGGDIVIISDHWDGSPTNYLWSSPHLNDLDDPAEIGSRAAALKAIYDGAMYVHRLGDYHVWPMERPIERHDVTLENLELRFPFEPFSEEWSSWMFETVEDPHRNPVSLYLFLAHYSDVVKSMLLFLGANGPSWISLYALKDFMEQAGKKEADLAKAVGVPLSALQLFRATANNFAAIGPFARHGEVGWLPPKDPMRLVDATKLILRCAAAFLEDEAKRVDTRAAFAVKTV